MRTLAFACILALGQTALAAGPSLKTNDDKALYTLGLQIGRSISVFDLSKKELSLVERAISDELYGKPALEIDQNAMKQLRDLATKRHEAVAKKNKASADKFMAKTAKEKGAQKLENGIVLFTTKPGTGANPKETDTVKVNYEGTLPNGQVFDSSYKRGKPSEFPLNRVVHCWTVGLQHMKVGESARLVCPPDQAYGENGAPGIPPNTPLTFKVDLLDAHATPAAQTPKFPTMPNMPHQGQPQH